MGASSAGSVTMASIASLRSSLLFALAVAFAAAGCASPGTGGALAAATKVADGPFFGTLPCADCDGIRTELTLYRAGGAPAGFLLRETYLGRPQGANVFESAGPWQEVGSHGSGGSGRIVRVDPYQPQGRRNFLRVGASALELLDRDERPIASRADLRLELSPTAALPEAEPARVLLAGMLRAADAAGLQLRRCADGAMQRVIDVSPENMVTAVLTDLGLDRRGEMYVEVFGRVVDGVAMFERLNRGGAEMRCPEAGAGLRWQAQGNEPFWALRADAERTSFLQPGEAPVAHPSIDLTWRWRGGRPDQARAYLYSQTEGSRFEAELTPGICRDTMADAAYGYRAQVTVADRRSRRTFSGCAYLGAGTAPP
jgi:uncharacterized membrane protein